jgi:hypothetical protein
MSPFVLVFCPICSQRLVLDPNGENKETDKEFYLRCPDEGQEEGKDSCFHISYEIDWTFKDITYFHSPELLIHVKSNEVHITEHARYAHELDLLNFQRTIDAVTTFLIFE